MVLNLTIMHFLIICAFCLIQTVYGSIGDSSPYFQKCTESCTLVNCTEDGQQYSSNSYNTQPIYLKLLLWDCESECKYDCMWKTTEAFQKRNWRIPQFYGKWPFVRTFGIQEPASLFFSLLNMLAHYLMIKKLKRKVRPDSPLYNLWHVFATVCIHAWIWSSIFHARDLPFTEFMDYICAFSIILINCYCALRRVFLDIPTFVVIIITAFFLAFFINHAIYLAYSRIDYIYNMNLNIAIASCSVITWFTWSLYNRKKQPYTWKCALYSSLIALSVILEVFDFPPIFWTFDSHALWHFSTALITPLFYNFIIDDCKYLRKIKQADDKVA